MQKGIRNPIFLIFTIEIIFVSLSLFFIFFYLSPKINRLIYNMPSRVEQMLSKTKGQYVPLSKISPYVGQAAISSQDERFYKNSGIDLRGTLRAVYFSITSGKRQGASTITEQLAKNIYYNDNDNTITDIETKILALYITQKYPKNKILEMYLNEIYFGKKAYGINSASKIFFNTSANKLTLSQSAFLIGMVDAPSYFSANLTEAKKQASLVIETMLKDKYISSNQETEAENSIAGFSE